MVITGATRPHSENESSSFLGMYQKQHHQQHACTPLYTRTCVEIFFFWFGILPFIVRTYLVCVPSSRVLYCSSVPRIILSSLACMTCLGSTAQQQSPFSLDSLVPYCRSARHVPTLEMRLVFSLICITNSTISSKLVHCCILVHLSCFLFFFGLGSCLSLDVRTSCVCRHPVSYIVHSEHHQLF